MEDLPITREKAIELLKKYPQTNSDFNHYLESEAVMRKLAEKFGENEDYWAMLGLLHDVDWGITRENIEEHLTKAPEILKEAGFDDKFIDIVLSHGYGFELPGLKDKERKEKVEFCLAAAETITGLIYAYALMRSKKISDMEVKGLRKKFKEKSFAPTIRRDIIMEIEKTGLKLDEFFEIAINAIKEIKEDIGLN
ncbi:MAG: HDIG domain-containing metalloprotein [archaeon]